MGVRDRRGFEGIFRFFSLSLLAFFVVFFARCCGKGGKDSVLVQPSPARGLRVWTLDTGRQPAAALFPFFILLLVLSFFGKPILFQIAII